MKAAVLTIGTEVTDGEITNTNASWLGSELNELGLEVCHHLSTPDDDHLIIGALEWLNQTNDWIFITGGLGPTSDDKTRELVGRFVGQPLVYDSEEWNRLEKLYKKRGLTLTESHKHQCYFPSQGTKMSNPVGSALGFRCQIDQTQVVVLPGPPRELRAVFDDNLRSDLEGLGLATGVPKKWTLLGITESEVAEVVEEIFSGGDARLGYRASVPYVHVKVWFGPSSDREGLSKVFTSKLGRYLVSEDGRDPIQGLLEALPEDRTVVFNDLFSGGILSTRLADSGAFSGKIQCATLSHDFNGMTIRADYVLSLFKSDTDVLSSVEVAGVRSEKALKVPYKLDQTSFRSRKYHTELAIQAWIELIKGQTLNRG